MDSEKTLFLARDSQEHQFQLVELAHVQTEKFSSSTDSNGMGISAKLVDELQIFLVEFERMLFLGN